MSKRAQRNTFALTLAALCCLAAGAAYLLGLAMPSPDAEACSPPPQYTINITDPNNGYVTKSPDQATYAAGTPVTITVHPDAGYDFVGWTGDFVGEAKSFTHVVSSNQSDAPSIEKLWTVHISVRGDGEVTFNDYWRDDTANPVTVDDCVGEDAYAFASGPATPSGWDTITLDAAPKQGSSWTFSHWEEDDGAWSACPSGEQAELATTSSLTVSGLTASKNIVAVFAPHVDIDQDGQDDAFQEVTIHHFGNGSVTAAIDNPTQSIIHQAACTSYATHYYLLAGTQVTLTATPDTGYHFNYWEGDVASTDAVETLAMDDDYVVKAWFSDTPTSPLGDSDHYWSFDEGTGTTVADSYGTADAAFANAVEWTSGQAGTGGVLLDEGDDFVRVTSTNLYDGTAMTLMGWMNPMSRTGSQVLLDVAGAGNTHQRAAIGVTFTGTGQFWASYAGTYYAWDRPVYHGRWTHVAAVCDASGVTLYVDGEDLGAADATGSAPMVYGVRNNKTFFGINSTDCLTMDSQTAGREVFYGKLDGAAIYYKTLRADEVQLAMHAAKAAAYTDLFDQPVGPSDYWDGFGGLGFLECQGVLDAKGANGPFDLTVSAVMPDNEISLWYKCLDYRARASIGTDEQQFRVYLRRSITGSSGLYLDISPGALRVVEHIGPTETVIAANTAVTSEPNRWYNIRMRVVDDDIRVWRRGSNGAWPATPELSQDGSVSGAFVSAGYGFRIDAPTGRSRYAIDNFRIRPHTGSIGSGIDGIDDSSNTLTIAVDPATVSPALAPSGGDYPLGECVYLSAPAEAYTVPGNPETGEVWVFDQWEGDDGDSVYPRTGCEAKIVMDSEKDITAAYRQIRWGDETGDDAWHGLRSGEDGYAPHGTTTMTLTGTGASGGPSGGLVESWTDGDGTEHTFLIAKVTIRAKNLPKNDDLYEVVIDDMSDLFANGEPLEFDYPVGTLLTIQAEPLDVTIYGKTLTPILFSWTTTPGTAINHCPTPMSVHAFRVPSSTGNTLSLKLNAPIVQPAAIHALIDFESVSVTADNAVVLVDESETPPAHRIIGPQGAMIKLACTPKDTAIGMQYVFGDPGFGQESTQPLHPNLSYAFVTAPLYDLVGARTGKLVFNGDPIPMLAQNTIVTDNVRLGIYNLPDGYGMGRHSGSLTLVAAVNAANPASGYVPCAERLDQLLSVDDFPSWGIDGNGVDTGDPAPDAEALTVTRTRLHPLPVIRVEDADGNTVDVDHPGTIEGDGGYSWFPGDPDQEAPDFGPADSVTLAVEPGCGLVLDHWEIDGSDVDESTDPQQHPDGVTAVATDSITLSMDSDRVVAAVLRRASIDLQFKAYQRQSDGTYAPQWVDSIEIVNRETVTGRSLPTELGLSFIWDDMAAVNNDATDADRDGVDEGDDDSSFVNQHEVSLWYRGFPNQDTYGPNRLVTLNAACETSHVGSDQGTVHLNDALIGRGSGVLTQTNAAPSLTYMEYFVETVHESEGSLDVLDMLPFHHIFVWDGHSDLGALTTSSVTLGRRLKGTPAGDERTYKFVFFNACDSAANATGWRTAWAAESFLGWIGVVPEFIANEFDSHFWSYVLQGNGTITATSSAFADTAWLYLLLLQDPTVIYPYCLGDTVLRP